MLNSPTVPTSKNCQNKTQSGDNITGDMVLGNLTHHHHQADTINIYYHHKPHKPKPQNQLVTPLIEAIGNFTEKGLIVLDANRNIQYCNPRFWNSLGFSPNTLHKTRKTIDQLAWRFRSYPYDLRDGLETITHSYKHKSVETFSLHRQDKTETAHYRVLPIIEGRSLTGVALLIIYEKHN